MAQVFFNQQPSSQVKPPTHENTSKVRGFLAKLSVREWPQMTLLLTTLPTSQDHSGVPDWFDNSGGMCFACTAQRQELQEEAVQELFSLTGFEASTLEMSFQAATESAGMERGHQGLHKGLTSQSHLAANSEAHSLSGALWETANFDGFSARLIFGMRRRAKCGIHTLKKLCSFHP